MGETDYDWDGLFDPNFDPISDPPYNDPFIPDTYGVDISSLTPDQQNLFNQLYNMSDDEFDAYIESLGLDTSGASPMANGDTSGNVSFWDRLSNAIGNVAGTGLSVAERNALNTLQSKTTRTAQESAALAKIQSDKNTSNLLTFAVVGIVAFLAWKQFSK